jgi:hypothetical protein
MEKLYTRKYKREKLQSQPLAVGDMFSYMYSNGYGSIKITKIENGYGYFSEYQIGRDYYSDHRKLKDTVKKLQQFKFEHMLKQHNNSEDVKEITHNILKTIKFDDIKGGSLYDIKNVKELSKALKKFINACEPFFVTGDHSIKTYYGSTELRHSRANTVWLSFNDIHRGGYYGFDKAYTVGILIGGAIPATQSVGIRDAAKVLLSKFQESYISTSDGTNYSSVLVVAKKGGGNTWFPLPKEAIAILS